MICTVKRCAPILTEIFFLKKEGTPKMKKYDQEFKDEAVSLALSSDRPLTEIALDLGVNYKTFGNWVRQAMVSRNQSLNKQSTIKRNYQ